MLVVLEGLDGAGKSTQVRMFKDYLQKRNGDLEYIHFPRYDAPVYGELISRFLRGDFGPIESVHPQLVALLFAEDRHGAAAAIRDVLSAGKTVLLDRYVYSNIAYQCAKLSDDKEAEALRSWIEDTVGLACLARISTFSLTCRFLLWSIASQEHVAVMTENICTGQATFMSQTFRFRSECVICIGGNPSVIRPS